MNTYKAWIIYHVYSTLEHAERLAAFSSFSLNDNPVPVTHISVFTDGEPSLDAKIKVIQKVSSVHNTQQPYIYTGTNQGKW